MARGICNPVRLQVCSPTAHPYPMAIVARRRSRRWPDPTRESTAFRPMIRRGSSHRARRSCRSIVNFSKALAASDSASGRVIYECGDLRWIWSPSWTSHRKRCSSRGSDSIFTVKCGSSLAVKCGSSAMFALCRDGGCSAMQKSLRHIQTRIFSEACRDTR